MVSKESKKIRGMFGAIANRYDLLNRSLSLGADQYWRWRVVRRLKHVFSNGSTALDLCTGTGDLAIQLARHGRVVGCDFTHGMLQRGHRKVERKNLDSRLRFVEGDALQLPFPEGRFSAVSIAFGLRNLESYRAGLKEMNRVLRPGGILAVLECSMPRLPLLRQLYLLYFKRLLPRLGRWVSGDPEAYSYLPASVDEFPSPEALAEMIEQCGFEAVEFARLTGGVAALHLARKEGEAREKRES